MDKRTTGIIATIASVVFCGCPGLGVCLFGALTAAGQGTFNDQSLAPSVGYVLLCLSVLFIAIPFVVGFLTLRKKPAASAPVVVEPIDNEPLPPAS